MAAQLSTYAKNLWLQALVDKIDEGVNPSVIELWEATYVEGTAVSTSGGTKLATLTLSKPCGTVANGTLTFNAITSDSYADFSGTIGMARIRSGDGGSTFVEIRVGDMNSSHPLKLTRTTVVQGEPIGINSLIISGP